MIANLPPASVEVPTTGVLSKQPWRGGVIYRGHKIRLDPNKRQEQFFWKCVGTARFAYNWALANWKQDYADGGRPSAFDLRRRLNSIKHDEFPWMAEVPCDVFGQSICDLGDAFTRFFKGQTRHPTFKRKHGARNSAHIDHGAGRIIIDGHRVRIPKLGWVRTFEDPRWQDGKPMSAILRSEGERWFLSVMFEIPKPIVRPHDDYPVAVGIDLGLKSAITLSTGEKFVAPKPLKWGQKKLRRLNKSLARKKKGSKNREKARRRLNRFHCRIKNIRLDWQHKTTTAIAKRFQLAFIEDLNTKGLIKNHSLARSIADVGWGELVRQLTYKMPTGKVGRFFASTKTCSCCDHKLDEIGLDVREWECPKCGAHHDRDVNAAMNILCEGLRLFSTAGCAGLQACGETGAGLRVKPKTKLDSTKQESSKTYLLVAR